MGVRLVLVYVVFVLKKWVMFFLKIKLVGEDIVLCGFFILFIVLWKEICENLGNWEVNYDNFVFDKWKVKSLSILFCFF